jgi:hypothetical protein
MLLDLLGMIVGFYVGWRVVWMGGSGSASPPVTSRQYNRLNVVVFAGLSIERESFRADVRYVTARGLIPL